MNRIALPLLSRTSTSGGLMAIAATLFTGQDVGAQQAQVLAPVEVKGDRSKELDLDRPSDTASRLGLTVRETPASIEVLDQSLLRRRGVRSVTEAAEAAVGVLAGDFPAEPSAFSMRGLANSQINTLYNGIKIGPANMTSRVMESANLERIEILKGPASLISGDGAVGGAVDLITRMPAPGPIVNEGRLSYGSFDTVRVGLGSGGSTSLEGLSYRFDLNGSLTSGFMDDSASRNWHLSSALEQRLSTALRVWGAVEFKGDRAKTSWGIPLISAAAAGSSGRGGIVDGSYVSNYNGTNLGAITVDDRALHTNYNVLDNHVRADEHWLRSGLEWQAAPSLLARAQVYRYGAKRDWFNNEVAAFNADTGLVDRERFSVSHDQSQWGIKSELMWDNTVAAMPNRLVAALDFSNLDFSRPGAADFPGDSVSVVDPVRGNYGRLTTRLQTTKVKNVALALEDRLRLNAYWTFVAGLRQETISLDRNSENVDGESRPGYPFSKSFKPTTGRLGLTVSLTEGVMAYGQYATGADVAANNLFLLGATQPLTLTRTGSFEAGVKADFWGGRGQTTFAVYNIDRRNVYSSQGGRSLNLAGKLASRGAEWAIAIQPTPAWKLHADLAYTHARYHDYELSDASFSGNTPPNVPKLIANLDATYRFDARWPIEIGASLRHVGDRYASDVNNVRLLAYNLVNAKISIEPRSGMQLSLRVRNIADRTYAAWADPFYPDQILIGAPRSAELALITTF